MLNLPHSLFKCFNQLILLLLLFHPVHAGDDELGDHPALGAGPGAKTQQSCSGTSPNLPQALRILPRGALSPQGALCVHSSWNNPIQGTQSLCLSLDSSKSIRDFLNVQKQNLFCECSRKPKPQMKVSQPFEMQAADGHFSEIWTKSGAEMSSVVED